MCCWSHMTGSRKGQAKQVGRDLDEAIACYVYGSSSATTSFAGSNGLRAWITEVSLLS